MILKKIKAEGDVEPNSHRGGLLSELLDFRKYTLLKVLTLGGVLAFPSVIEKTNTDHSRPTVSAEDMQRCEQLLDDLLSDDQVWVFRLEALQEYMQENGITDDMLSRTDEYRRAVFILQQRARSESTKMLEGVRNGDVNNAVEQIHRAANILERVGRFTVSTLATLEKEIRS